MHLHTRNFLKRIINGLLEKYGLQVVNSASHLALRELSRDRHKLKLVMELPPQLSRRLTHADIINSTSQLGADLVALALLGKSKGSFVEFGACDGKTLSNSYLLEKCYDWYGALSEPSTVWHAELHENRRCTIETKCVSDRSGEFVRFSEAARPEFSGLSNYSSNKDQKSDVLNVSIVETISLNQLLANTMPNQRVNYMSVDTEGGEYQILSALDFETWTFDFISVEHNYSDQEHLLETLINSKGYTRILAEISDFDAWFVRNELFEKYWDTSNNG